MNYVFAVAAGAALAAALSGCIVTREFSQGPSLPPAPLPAYSPGDQFHFDNGRTETVVAVDANKGEVTWRSEKGITSRRLASFIVPRLEWMGASTGGAFLSDDASNALWPLTQHSRQTFSGTLVRRDGTAGIGHGEQVAFDCWVGATRTVTVPAGTFDTYLINCSRRSTGSVRRSRLYNWYYAPTINHYVMREIAGEFGDINETVSLVRWTDATTPGGG